MDVSPYDLRCFLEVSRTLNISRAAEKLGMGQPALSQLVRRLESQFGTTLLNRYKTGVRLTAAGLRLSEIGLGALDDWAKLREKTLAAEVQIEGKYTLGCHPSVALYTLKEFVPKLLGKHPALQLSLIHGLSREIAEGVISFRVDFGIVINPVKHPDLIIRELCFDEVGFWSVPDTIGDTLIYNPDLIQSQALIRRAQKTLKELKISRTLESSSLEVIADLAASGCGMAVLPARVAKRFGVLRSLNHLPKYKDKLCLIYRADRRLAAAGIRIIEAIRQSKI